MMVKLDAVIIFHAILPVLERLRMLEGCVFLGELRPDIQPPKSLLMSLMS